MHVKPIRQKRVLLPHLGPAVSRILARDQLMRDLVLGEFRGEADGLFVRDQRVGIAVDDEGRRRGPGNGGERRELAQHLELVLLRFGLNAERVPDVLDRFELHEAAAGFAVVDEVGRGAEAGDGLDLAGGAVDGVLGVGVAGFAGDAEGEREEAAGAGAEDAEAIGIDAVVLGMNADVADRAVNVGDDLADGEAGLSAMAHQEEGVAAVEEGLEHDGAVEPGIDQVDPGLEGGADHEDRAAAVLLARLPDIHRQRHAELAAIHDITSARVVLCLAQRRGEHQNGERDRSSVRHHMSSGSHRKSPRFVLQAKTKRLKRWLCNAS